MDASELLNSLSFRQARLATAVEALLHSQGFNFDSTTRAVRLALTHEATTVANAKKSKDMQASAQAINRKVDGMMDAFAADEDLRHLPDERGRHHLVCRVGRQVFGFIRDRLKVIESRILQGASALVQVGDLIGFVAEFGDPVLWLPVEWVDRHYNHVCASRVHGNLLWPGATDMTDEALDLAFWKLHSRSIERDDWVQRFADSTTEQVVCWGLGEPLPPSRVPNGVFCRALEYAVSQTQHRVGEGADKKEAPAQQTAQSGEEPPESTEAVIRRPRAYMWRRLLALSALRRGNAARRIQRYESRRLARQATALLAKSVVDGPAEGVAEVPFPEVPRDDPSQTQCS
jgi:hypothetical protein